MSGYNLICKTCKNDYTSSHKRQKFCSLVCFGKTLVGTHLSEKSKEKIRMAKLGEKHSEETKAKLREIHKNSVPPHHKGKKHYRWIEDRTQVKQYWLERNNPEYKQWRKSVLVRDGYKCKMQNRQCCGKIIVHHILGWSAYPELRYDVNNGIALCHYHHPRKRADEARLSPYFKELIKII